MSDIEHVSRKRVMLELRRRGLNDSKIGERFGLTRERVGQILGRKKTDRNLAAKRFVQKDRLSRIAGILIRCGVTRKEMQRRMGLSYKAIQSLTAGIDEEAYQEQISRRARERTDAEIGSRLIKFASEHPVTVTAVIENLGIAFLSAMTRRMPVTKWREFLALAQDGTISNSHAYAEFLKFRKNVLERERIILRSTSTSARDTRDQGRCELMQYC